MREKLKVLQIIPNLGLGGAEIMVENLSVALKKDGFCVSIVSLYDYHSAITKRLKDENITVLYLGKKKGFDIKTIYRLYKLFKNEKPDIIHSHIYAMPYSVIAAILAKVPVKVHTIHNIADKEFSKGKRKINKFIYKYFGVVPVAISPLVKKSIINEYGLLNNQVPMVYNGLSLEKCIPKNKYCSENRMINILHIGRFSEQKNHIGLIESFKIVHDKNPKTVLKLIGDGELKKVIEKRVKEFNLEDSVEFLGLQSNVYNYLTQADIFVLPSLWEGMPITLIEAMGTGLPIVATGVGGVPDMIENNVTGLIVDINKEQIAEALLKLVTHSNLMEKLGSSAKATAVGFSAQKMAKEYSEIYRDRLIY